MKKLLLLGASFLAIGISQAQVTEGGSRILNPSSPAFSNEPENGGVLKTAYASDTGYMTLGTFLPKGFANNYTREIFDTSIASRVDAVTPNDSGYIFGTNRILNRGYAEKFYFQYKADTLLRILGVRALFSGRVQANSTKQVTFAIYRRAAESAFGTPKVFNSGLPGATVGPTLPVNANKLGTNGVAGVDTIKNFYFSTRFTLAATDTQFYLGYTMPAYTYAGLNNDTFGVRSTRGGYGFNVGGFLRGTAPQDTVLTNQNVFMNNAGTWNDIYWTYGYVRNLSMIPIVQLQGSKFTGVETGLTRNGLTFMGAFPNPAVNQSTVRVSLKRAVGVTLEVSDENGRTLRSNVYSNLAVGQHDIQVPVSELPAGNYVITVQTSEGDAIATAITVIK